MNKQRLYDEIFTGILIYAVTLGFFNDYTSLVEAKSFSTIFLASIILQILTSLTFSLKSLVLSKVKSPKKAIQFLAIWPILFFSKFIFIWLIDFIFQENINISGFKAILLIIMITTLAGKLSQSIYKKLA
jgi:hypothetical protein